MKAIDPQLFKEPAATQLANQRFKMRGKKRITYDCMNSIVKNDKVDCKIGKFDHPLPLFSVLAGRSSNICNHCLSYNEEIEE